MFERVYQGHIKRAFQVGIEECIPAWALCHILRIHVFCLCMRPEFGGRLGKRRRSDFFFRLGWGNFSDILPRSALLYISSAHIGILREDDVSELRIAPKTFSKLSFEPITIDPVTGSQNDVTSD